MASSKEMREQWEAEKKRGSTPLLNSWKRVPPLANPPDDEYVELDQNRTLSNNDDLGIQMVDRNTTRPTRIQPSRPTVMMPPRDGSLAGQMGARNKGGLALRGASGRPTSLPPSAPVRFRPAERASSPPPRGAGGFIPQVLKRVVAERREDPDESGEQFVSRRKQMLAAQREAALPPPGPKDCVFCRRTQTPVKTSTHFYAQWDTRPVAKGHALVIPFRHVTSYFDLSTDEAAELHALIKSTKTHIDSMHRPDGYNVGVNDGEWAGQTTPHLHVHILPRYKGDVAAPVGGIRRILSR